MSQEIKICQNCKVQFTIEPEDFTFYEKIKVPPPTWCPECRMIRRMVFRNERALYKGTCALCRKNIITMYAPNSPFTVHCTECYQSNKWDPLSYAQNHDFSKPFFAQFADLFRAVPRRALYFDFAVNSDYTNWGLHLKDAYLVFGGHHYENVAYASQCIYLKDCFDTDFLWNSEQCYESLHLRKCNRVYFSLYSEECLDSWFLIGCRNCQHCFGCVNLRNKTYCIFNKQYAKEDYERALLDMDLGLYDNFKKFRDKFHEHALRYPRKYAWMRNVVNSTGDDIENSKDCRVCFSIEDAENLHYVFYGGQDSKDGYDLDHVGVGSQLVYEALSAFALNRVAFITRVYYSHDVSYSDDCYNSAYLFGCIGLRKKEYCILNKQYSKEEYKLIVSKIIDQMKRVTYTDGKGHAYNYGEFFPPEISPFAYNETVAQEHFPLTRERAVELGFRWREPDTKSYKITKAFSELPQNINDVEDNILNEVISCAHEGKCNEQCTTAFRIIPAELQFLRTVGIPIPRLCPNCRHYQRLKQRNPLKLWHRKCGCTGNKLENSIYQNSASHFHGTDHCPNEFETSYAPERKEIVYCEQCYNAEVV